ncbi:PREDICTED: V-type proton ATPase subunit S1-like protein [Crocodylus porosus]|uniref:V-type proton ATPase subunit S1-like protein n=1 Tax=Crocodylus porosus TaxID=8502 RepID=UPI00093B787D|nr:PREDICTED: V-type proton ATPase subunit S1-like protein [Crocodylus porosus]
MVGHPHFTTVEANEDEHCIAGLGVFLEIVMSKNMLKQFPKGGTCTPDPVLDRLINVRSLRELATKISINIYVIFLFDTGLAGLQQHVFGKSGKLSTHAFSDEELPQRNEQQFDGGVKPKLNINQVAITQIVNYNLSRRGQSERESWGTFTHSHHSPVNVTINGIPCILFWAKRIMIKFKNHTQLDLTEKTFGIHATVDVGDSNCSEDSATLSLKFGDIDNLKDLVIRFLLTSSYYKLSVQNWFSLHRVQILYNHSIQATFNATQIYAPASYSYHCEHVSSLQRYDALLMPSSANDVSRLWEVTFIDFQIQGFNIEEGHFAYAKDCASFFSPAILMGLVMSLILLLVLAYALHMLIHLKSLDRHYECKASPAYFGQMKDSDMADEKEPLRNNGNESYELRNQEFCKIYI